MTTEISAEEAKMESLDPLIHSSALNVDDLAFTGSTKMLQVYHEFVQPGTDVLETRLSLPSEIAPMLSLCAGVFVPLYFLGSLLFSWLRFSGSIKCVCYLRSQ